MQPWWLRTSLLIFLFKELLAFTVTCWRKSIIVRTSCWLVFCFVAFSCFVVSSTFDTSCRARACLCSDFFHMYYVCSSLRPLHLHSYFEAPDFLQHIYFCFLECFPDYQFLLQWGSLLSTLFLCLLHESLLTG